MLIAWNGRGHWPGLTRFHYFVISTVCFLSLFLLPNVRSFASPPSSSPSAPTPFAENVAPVLGESNPAQPKYAFATYLSSNENEGHYFVATRLLTYQLLYAPETKSSPSIPFLVLVLPDLPEEKRERLRKDGATVVEVEPLNEDWIVTDNKNWEDVLTKLRLFEMTHWDRIAFLDGDTVLNAPLDGIFDDPAAMVQQTLENNSALREDEASLPSTYVFGGTAEMSREHHYPPVSEADGDYQNDDYLNAGFFVLRPDRGLFDYYMSILRIPNRYDSQFPEQNLMNYAHRKDGNMPWQHVEHTWNIHYPTLTDLEMGCKSLHEKWWDPVDDSLVPYMESWRWRMEGFFEARDLAS